MTLIIAARCNDGCVVVSDTRQHIKDNTGIRYDDGYLTALICRPHVVYNHGYNRIDNKDWRLQAKNLTPDVDNPIYKRIQKEMKFKPDKKAFYVFVNKNVFHEISIDAEGSISIHTEKGKKNELHKSGSGAEYVDFSILKDIKSKRMKVVKKEMECVFIKAHDKLLEKQEDKFSADSKIICFKC